MIVAHYRDLSDYPLGEGTPWEIAVVVRRRLAVEPPWQGWRGHPYFEMTVGLASG